MTEIFGEAFIAVTILLLGLCIPMFLLLLGWAKPVTEILSILAIANNLSRVSDVLLIVIPLGTVSYIAAFVFGFRGNHTLWRSLFIPCLFLPTIALIISQIVLYWFLFVFKERPLLDADFFWAAAAIYCSITCVMLLEVYMSISRSVTRRQGL